MEIMIRIAWYDKIIKVYNTGSWHHYSKLDYKKKWIEEQNKKYPFNYYWIEGCKVKKNETVLKKYENDMKCYPNIETFNIETFNIEKNDSNNDWCLVTQNDIIK